MRNIKVLGIDLAQLHETDAKGKCVLRKRLSREKLAEPGLYSINWPGFHPGLLICLLSSRLFFLVSLVFQARMLIRIG